MEYANVIWAPFLNRQSRLIERTQMCGTKILHDCEVIDYSQSQRQSFKIIFTKRNIQEGWKEI